MTSTLDSITTFLNAFSNSCIEEYLKGSGKHKVKYCINTFSKEHHFGQYLADTVRTEGTTILLDIKLLRGVETLPGLTSIALHQLPAIHRIEVLTQAGVDTNLYYEFMIGLRAWIKEKQIQKEVKITKPFKYVNPKGELIEVQDLDKLETPGIPYADLTNHDFYQLLTTLEITHV